MTKPNRRMAITVSVVLIIALLGVITIRINSSQAQKLSSSSTTGQTDSELMQSTTTTPSPVPSLMKIGAALAAVVICIYVGLFLLKKAMGRKYSGGGQGGHLEVLESMYVAPKKTVSLIRVGERTVLIGVTEAGVNMLTEFDEVNSASFVAPLEQSVTPTQFAGLLKTASQKIKEFRAIKKSPALEI